MHQTLNSDGIGVEGGAKRLLLNSQQESKRSFRSPQAGAWQLGTRPFIVSSITTLGARFHGVQIPQRAGPVPHRVPPDGHRFPSGGRGPPAPTD
jgi:hypothetical protein